MTVFHFCQAIARAGLTVDVILFKLINSHHTVFFDRFFSLATYLGNGWAIIPLLFVLVLWRAPRSKRILVLASAALALSIGGLANSFVKELVDRPRPSIYFVPPETQTAPEGERLFGVHMVGKRLNDDSFPSGHTNTAFALATLAVLILGKRFWPGFILAATVAYSRIYLGFHFPLDTLAGACMGSAIALLVWRGASRVRQPERRQVH
jgi:membrane-associated phospholipid phosphatase